MQPRGHFGGSYPDGSVPPAAGLAGAVWPGWNPMMTPQMMMPQMTPQMMQMQMQQMMQMQMQMMQPGGPLATPGGGGALGAKGPGAKGAKGSPPLRRSPRNHSVPKVVPGTWADLDDAYAPVSNSEAGPSSAWWQDSESEARSAAMGAAYQDDEDEDGEEESQAADLDEE